jgi:uncharacterized protein
MRMRMGASGRLLLACLLAATLGGCLSQNRPIEFYTLSPLPRPVGESGGAPGTIVAVYPAMIPATIDRPQIVTRTAENQVVLAEFSRWGGTLKEEITRVLIENLNILLADRHVDVMGDNLALDPQFFVAVTFNRLEGRLGDKVWLNAAWTVRDQRSKKMLAVKTSTLQENVSGLGYAELVAAQSRALTVLSREIAAELSAVIRTP